MPILTQYVTAVGATTRVRFYFDANIKKILHSVSIDVVTRPFIDVECNVSDKRPSVGESPNVGELSSVFNAEKLNLYTTGSGTLTKHCNVEFRGYLAVSAYGTVAADIMRVDINYSEEKR